MQDPAPTSAFAPLRHATFRNLWTASLASNTGMWVQNTGAGWLMTSLDPSPLMVSLVQAASMLPVFLLALPTGALADIVDRRRYLIFAQSWMCLMGLVLCILTATGLLGPWGLLALTFGIGAGSAMNFPAWAATTPELVPREDLTQAIVLNGIGFNLARAVGPALGGFVIGLAGTQAAFAFNAACFLVLILALVAWRREEAPRTLPKEHFLSAMRAGMRFVAASPALRRIILRAVVFFFFGSAMWGLLPLVVRERLGLGPEAFGMLLAAMGIGAVAGGLLLPRLRARVNRGDLVVLASLAAAAALVLLGFGRHWAPVGLGMLLYGSAWISASSTLQAAAQMVAPAWVRARAIGIYQLSFFGALAFGSALAGWLGTIIGVHWALLGFGGAGGVAALVMRRWTLGAEAAAEAAPAAPLRPEEPAPELAPLLAQGRGRLLEVVRYHIRPQDRGAFLAAMAEVRRARLRSGALNWQLCEDIAYPERWVELWAVENWNEHLREQSRLGPDDHAAIGRAAALHQGETGPKAVRYIHRLP
ncbi:MFS transporter [Roseomonas sp. M0104]|uniref:MFS transporter n=1 Tax=Teichococcus coralli TaxID=2545983 RepID=A0A845B9T8_9PROT|nr:MFS transporter [Pseudoroseomonas coralli]MXP63348.1 MFS transporter [Pseudoroseomonas coralli]